MWSERETNQSVSPPNEHHQFLSPSTPKCSFARVTKRCAFEIICFFCVASVLYNTRYTVLYSRERLGGAFTSVPLIDFENALHTSRDTIKG